MKMMRRWLLCFLSITFLSATAVAFTTADSVKANENSGMGNVARSEDVYLNVGAGAILDADITEADDVLVSNAVELNGGEYVPVIEEEPEPEITLVMADVENELNVRAEASADSELVGKLYAECGGQILERQDGWTKLQSGNLIGWASDEYLLFGEEAESFAIEVGENQATILTDGLKVRREAATDAVVCGLLKKGENVTVHAVEGDWIYISCGDCEGYISNEYAEISFNVDAGETVEEIKEREEAEAAAEAAARESAAARRAAMQEEKAYVVANYSELEILGALIWCEAGNQSYEGKLAVGAVVMNRVNNPRYPNTIADVIYAPGQFTPAMYGKVLRVLERGVNATCLQAAQDALNGISNVGDRTHFNRVEVRSSDLIIGDHAFW